MHRREFINARWKADWDKSPVFARLARGRQQVLQAQAALDALEASRQKMSSEGSLSAKGITQKLQEQARASIVPAVRRADHAVAVARKEIAQQREALSVPKPNPTDAAGAIRRMEIRGLMRSMSSGELAKILSDPKADTDVLQAIFEVPAFVSGIEPGLRTQIERSIIERERSGELAILDDLQEASDVVGGAAQMAFSDLTELVEIKGAPGEVLDRWLEKASADVDQQIAVEEKTAPVISPDMLAAAAEVIAQASTAQSEGFSKWMLDARLATIMNKPVPAYEPTPAAAAA